MFNNYIYYASVHPLFFAPLLISQKIIKNAHNNNYNKGEYYNYYLNDESALFCMWLVAKSDSAAQSICMNHFFTTPPPLLFKCLHFIATAVPLTLSVGGGSGLLPRAR